MRFFRKNMAAILIVSIIAVALYSYGYSEGFQTTCPKGKILKCATGTLINNKCYTCPSGKTVSNMNGTVWCITPPNANRTAVPPPTPANNLGAPSCK